MSEPATPTLSELLRTFRTRAGLTQAALAEKAGLSEQAISVLERGTRSRPRQDTVRSLTAALGLSPTEAAQFLSVARSKGGSTPIVPVTTPSSDPYPTPWQLPPAVPDFTGRVAQMDAVLSVLRAADDRSEGVRLVAITGMGGVGKTTLAVHAAHKLVAAYPDGHLYLNLRGYDPGGPMNVRDALRHLLRSLGLDLHQIPEHTEEAAALLRSQLAGRRVLMLLDNAADASQVMHLLPGSPGSAAVITSRESLATLAGARQIRLDALSETESVELLTDVIGPDRAAAEPDAVSKLVLFTGRLPLAVRLIGGRLASRPQWPIQHLVELLQNEGDRLDGLGADDTGVRESIASSVRFLESSDGELDRAAAGVLPMLGILDGSDLLTMVAAHLLDLPLRRTGAILERLVDVNLIGSTGPDRYRFHDLIRAYARELADKSLTLADRDAALERVLRFYISTAWACQAMTHEASPRLALAGAPVEPVPKFATVGAAARWFDDEYPNLMDRVAQASASPITGTPLLPQLALSLFGYNEFRERWIEMRTLGQGVVEQAQQQGLPLMAAWLQHDRAIPDVENGDLASAASFLRKSLDMFRELDDAAGQARCCSSLTYVLGQLGQLSEALDFGNESLRLSQQLGDVTLEGVAYTAVGGLYDRMGDPVRADAAFDRAIALAEQAGDIRSHFKRVINAGFSHLLVGRYTDAATCLQRSLALAEQANNDAGYTESQHTLALIMAAQGDYEAGRRHAQTALVGARRLKNRIREGRLLLELARISAASGDRTAAITNAETAATLLAKISPLHERYAKDLLALLQRGDDYTYVLTAHSL